MPSRTKVREVTVTEEGGAFTSFFKRFTSDSSAYDFESLSLLRKLMSNQRTRLLHTIKTKKPASLYALAKLLGRDFKAVLLDVKLLERFGFIEMLSEKSGKRNRLRPILATEELIIKFKF